MDKTTKVKAYRGLNNTSDPLELGHEWLIKAQNVDINSAGRVVTREGYSSVETGTFSSIYSTQDFSRMFVVKDFALMERMGDGSYRLLMDDIDDSRMYWAELNGDVYFNNGVDSGIIKKDGSVIELMIQTPQAPNLSIGSGILPAGQYRVCCTFVSSDGREGGSGDIASVTVQAGGSLVISGIPQIYGCRTNVYISPADSDIFFLAFDTVKTTEVWSLGPEFLGQEMQVFALNSMPYNCGYISFWKGSLWAMKYVPEDDITVICKSKPFAFHLFDLLNDIYVFKGFPKYMNSNSKGIVFGVEDKIYGFDGESVVELAQFGIVEGQDPVADDDELMIFWTVRGLCSCFPFVKMTNHVSVAPGVSAAGCIIQKNGGKRFISCLKKGGESFNSWSE
jgi:hypothetical protein